MLRIATKEYFDSLERFLKHMRPEIPVDLLILKGHLLVESLLEKYISKALAKPDRLKEARLSFAQKLSLVAAMSSEERDSWLWEAISLLNRLRNDLVHDVEKPSHVQLTTRFISAVEASPELPSLEPPPHFGERLHRAIFGVHEALVHRVDL